MPDGISINAPKAGNTVARVFLSMGAWEYSSSPTITVVLKDSSGTTVATGITSVNSGGSWTSTFNVTQDYSNASISATIDGSTFSASVSGIAITNPPAQGE